MKKRMIAFLLLGISCVIAGLILARLGVKPGALPAVMVAVGGGWIGASAIMFISTKGGTLVRDEMVVRVQTLSGSYALDATIWFVIVLATVNIFYSLPWSVTDLLLTEAIFMGVSKLLFRWILLKRGKAE
jgi:ABC-type Fe3+-siderophore transport system permease subunit